MHDLPAAAARKNHEVLQQSLPAVEGRAVCGPASGSLALCAGRRLRQRDRISSAGPLDNFVINGRAGTSRSKSRRSQQETTPSVSRKSLECSVNWGVPGRFGPATEYLAAVWNRRGVSLETMRRQSRWAASTSRSVCLITRMGIGYEACLASPAFGSMCGRSCIRTLTACISTSTFTVVSGSARKGLSVRPR